MVDVGDDAVGDGGREAGCVGGGGDNGEVGVCGMNCIVDQGEAVCIGTATAVKVVFVADLKVLDVPRLGAAVLGTQGAVGRVCGAEDVLLVLEWLKGYSLLVTYFKFIENVVDVGIQS